MPDAYELKHRLNPRDATDAATITVSGYSNIELYLNNEVDVKQVKPVVVNK